MVKGGPFCQGKVFCPMIGTRDGRENTGTESRAPAWEARHGAKGASTGEHCYILLTLVLLTSLSTVSWGEHMVLVAMGASYVNHKFPERKLMQFSLYWINVHSYTTHPSVSQNLFICFCFFPMFWELSKRFFHLIFSYQHIWGFFTKWTVNECVCQEVEYQILYICNIIIQRLRFWQISSPMFAHWADVSSKAQHGPLSCIPIFTAKHIPLQKKKKTTTK